MRLLVVGFASSIHTARYLRLLAGTGWDIHLFDSGLDVPPHPALPSQSITLHGSPNDGHRPPNERQATFDRRVRELAELIGELEPDVIHSHELQHGGAMVDCVRDGGRLPAPWLVTNWGSDILFYRDDAARVPRIRSILGACDYYCAECHRDVALARGLGLRGTVVGVWPVAGGIDLEHAATLRAPGPTSARRAIAVKGAQSWVGQAQHAVTAIERNVDLLQGWEVCGYQVHPDSERRLRALGEAADIRYTQLAGEHATAPHDDVLAMHGRSRVSLGLNLSDGLSTSFQEAMTMGSFPVQSRGSCGREITPPGRGALFVSPTDPDAVTAALRRALTDDELVDEAAAINARAAALHLDDSVVRARIVDAYERIAQDAMLHAV
jgi:Glycosyl transferase 4-like